mmetsp:Transcript_10670/g.14253  ORF Transcript_10670/g.14253 Transcript_10670/m.14253 type:complete len:124 (+) Transcript_10670:67-438(+)
MALICRTTSCSLLASLEAIPCDACLVIRWADAQFSAPIVGTVGVGGVVAKVATAAWVTIALHLASMSSGNARSLWQVPLTRLLQWMIGVTRSMGSTDILIVASSAWVCTVACGIRRLEGQSTV